MRVVVLGAALLVCALASWRELYASPPLPSPAFLEQGQKVYAQACAPCHGLSGDGNGPLAFAINPKPRNFRKDPFKGGDNLEQIYATITNGLPDTKMVGYPQISEQDRWAIAYIVLAFRPPK
jgi:high-affinity iron transporter